MSTSKIDVDKDRERLHQKFGELGLRGYWQNRRDNQRMEPRLWRWKDVYPVLMEAAEVIRVGPDAFRRNVGLVTGSRTLAMGFQIVLPGEKAAAHRHANTALRFVVSGKGDVYTTSDGEPMLMEPGDLLIQPNWVWHDHVNNSKDPVIWVDALDAGLVRFLDASRFREEWAAGKTQPLTKNQGASRRLYSSVRRPHVDFGDAAGFPYQYKWGEALEALNELADQEVDDPYDGCYLEYKNPINGGHTFLTMSCYLQMLRPGQETHFHRHTGTVLYHTIQGHGRSVIGKSAPTEFEWGAHDSFSLPPWRWHAHRNLSDTESAILFSVTDRPLLEMTGLDREQGD